MKPGSYPWTVVAGAVWSTLVLSLAVATPSAAEDERETEETIHEVAGDIKPPIRLLGQRAIYPPKALESRLEGEVTVRAVIGRDGKATSATAADDGPPEHEPLRQAAVAAVRTWEFWPATLERVPVAVHYPIRISFRIRDGKPQIDEYAAVREPASGSPVIPPVKISAVPPVYPKKAKKAGLEGPAVVLAMIEADGSVSGAKVVTAPSAELGEAAVEAIRQWRFRPATVDGEPVRVEYNLMINFRLGPGKG